MSAAAIRALVDDLAGLPGDERTFNPYAPDDPGGAVRRANLIRFLTYHADQRTPALMLLEAPGYRGCARTGIPITSERIMLGQSDHWGLFGAGYRPTSGQPGGMAEMSASILWAAIGDQMDRPPLLWNAFPLHPHKPGDRETNRTPRVSERRMGLPFVERVIDLYRFEVIFGVGRKAQHSLAELGIAHHPLRHPSQGGKAEFIAGLEAALKGR